MTLPMVWPAVVVMLTFLAMSPSGPFNARLITPPAARPLASPELKPVAVTEGYCDLNRSLRPKNCEKPVVPRCDGVVASSCTTMPLLPVAEMESWPLTKEAVPLAPKAAFRAVAKLPRLVPMLTEAPPSTLKVPAVKFTSIRDTRLPLELVTAMVVLPVKPSPSPDNKPVWRPVSVVGGG